MNEQLSAKKIEDKVTTRLLSDLDSILEYAQSLNNRIDRITTSLDEKNHDEKEKRSSSELIEDPSRSFVQFAFSKIQDIKHTQSYLNHLVEKLEQFI